MPSQPRFHDPRLPSCLPSRDRVVRRIGCACEPRLHHETASLGAGLAAVDNGHIPGGSDYTGGDTEAENLALQSEVKGMRDLVDLYRERLSDADRRYQELLEQLNAMTKALPATGAAPPQTKRWWWPFR